MTSSLASRLFPVETVILVAAIKGRWTKRELERQILTGAALRSDAGARKVSPVVAQTHPTAIEEFKNHRRRAPHPREVVPRRAGHRGLEHHDREHAELGDYRVRDHRDHREQKLG